MSGFFDLGGRPLTKTPLTRGQIIDLVDAKRRLIEEIEDREAREMTERLERANA